MLFFSTPSFGQDLVYEPVNPSFGGNSFNSAHLLAIANAQNDFDPPEEESTSQDDLDRFVRSLQSRLLSSLSTQVANAIFGEDAQDQGTIIFGDQTIEFVRTLEGIQLTIRNADGSETVITIPTLITDDSDETEDDSSSADEEGMSPGSANELVFTPAGSTAPTSPVNPEYNALMSSPLGQSSLSRSTNLTLPSEAAASADLSQAAPIQ